MSVSAVTRKPSLEWSSLIARALSLFRAKNSLHRRKNSLLRLVGNLVKKPLYIRDYSDLPKVSKAALKSIIPCFSLLEQGIWIPENGSQLTGSSAIESYAIHIIARYARICRLCASIHT